MVKFSITDTEASIMICGYDKTGKQVGLIYIFYVDEARELFGPLYYDSADEAVEEARKIYRERLADRFPMATKEEIDDICDRVIFIASDFIEDEYFEKDR